MMEKPLAKVVLGISELGFSVFAGFAWFTYGFLGLDSKGPAPLPMVAASLGVIVVGVVAATFAGRRVFAEFRSF